MTTTVGFVLTLNQAATAPVTVAYATRNGTAIAGTDYAAAAGTVTFPAGSVSQPLDITILDSNPPIGSLVFYVDLTAASGGVVIKSTGTCTISAAAADTYLERHINVYYLVTTTNKSQYFGPPTGANAHTIPYHAVEQLIVEAPDYGHESVSETVSFWVKLEAYHMAAVPTSATAYNSVWSLIDSTYVPSSALQPTVTGYYNPANPASFIPGETTTTAYPAPVNNLGSYNGTGSPIVTGADPLASGLLASYSSPTVYLMHWIWDVDGEYGFHNGDNTTTMVAINSFERGLSESVWLAVMHPEWEDFANGGNSSQGGYSGLYKQAGTGYAKQYGYTNAPDAEGRTIACSYVAAQVAAANSLNVTTSTTNAKKMGDYSRYALYDKYFQPIGRSSGMVSDGSGCHYLNSWYVGWGGGDPAAGPSSEWAYRIGSSEIHFGYNNVDAAYAMAEDFSPVTSGAQAQWENSLARQLELVRWLQTSTGPIAGGVSNSWYDSYQIPTDGRGTACFYGMYYTYAPVYHNPPSNGWVGWQFWGLERVAKMCLLAAGKSDSISMNGYSNGMVILDRFVVWVLNNVSFDSYLNCTLPDDLVWTSPTQIAGHTTTAPNLEGVYEYLPSLNWNSSGDYSTFWSGSSVPNPNLHVTTTGTTNDLGVISCMAQLLIQYVKAKLVSGGALTDIIPNSSFSLQQALTVAQHALDGGYANNLDAVGAHFTETRTDYSQFAEPVYIPTGYGTGTTPDGNSFSHGNCTFISTRSFMTAFPGYAAVESYINGGPPPVFQYHRFWTQSEFATGLAMMAVYFPTTLPTN